MDNKTLIQRTEAAYNLNCLKLDYDELIGLLSSDNENLICYALLNIEKILNPDHAGLIMAYLNNSDSRIREFSSGVVKEHIINPETRFLFDNDSCRDIVIEAVKDVNPKVCRNIINTLPYMDNKDEIIGKLIKIVESGSLFTQYWGLYAIENLLNLDVILRTKSEESALYSNLERRSFVNTQDDKVHPMLNSIISLLTKTAQSKDYQIRERTAFIVKILKNNVIVRHESSCHSQHSFEMRENLLNYDHLTEAVQGLVDKLSKDSNFYVKTAVF